MYNIVINNTDDITFRTRDEILYVYPCSNDVCNCDVSMDIFGFGKFQIGDLLYCNKLEYDYWIDKFTEIINYISKSSLFRFRYNSSIYTCHITSLQASKIYQEYLQEKNENIL
jgi:hypothetical protein